MTDTLDEDLAAAAPVVAGRTPALRATVQELIVETDQYRRREVADTARRRRRVSAVALTVATLVGAGTTAAATGWVNPAWWEKPEAVTVADPHGAGADCRVTYAPRALDDPSHPVSDADRDAAMAAAAEFLRTVDYTTVADGDPDLVVVKLDARLREALRSQGLASHAVSVALTWDCPEGPQ